MYTVLRNDTEHLATVGAIQEVKRLLIDAGYSPEFVETLDQPLSRLAWSTRWTLPGTCSIVRVWTVVGATAIYGIPTIGA